MEMPDLETGVRRIVDKNVDLMRSTEKGGMMSFGESMSSRDRWQGLPWGSFNFYFDKDSGEIAYFRTGGSGILKENEKTEKNLNQGRFNVAYDYKNEKEGVFAITVEDKSCPGVLVLGLTALAYNKKYDWDLGTKMTEERLDL
ncbi:hypothetical protein ACFLZB_02995 [Nanoarchaeota archaeon]